jgi:hypothetical protein
MDEERKLHDRFREFRGSGEWFLANAAVMQAMMRSIAFGQVMHDSPKGSPLARVALEGGK